MKLAHAQEHPPPRGGGPERAGGGIPEDEQGGGVGEGQDGAHDELRVAEAGDGDERLAHAGEQDGADKGAGHDAGEGEVVVGVQEARAHRGRGRAVDEDVVRGLQVERLLDLGVGRDEDVREGQEEEQRVEQQVCMEVVSAKGLISSFSSLVMSLEGRGGKHVYACVRARVSRWCVSE